MAPREVVRGEWAGSGWLSGREQAHHPDQVVRAGDQVASHPCFVQADVARAAESASCFHPAKYFFDPLADALTDGIPGMPCRSAIDRTTPPTRVLGHVGRHVPRTEVGDTRLGVVALVRSQRPWSEPIVARLVDQAWNRIPFGCAGGLSHLKVDQEPIVVFHERVAGVRQAGFFARTFLGQQRFGISPALMRRIRALLPMEVHPPIAGRAAGALVGWLVSRSEALEAGRGFDQRAVHREVLIAQQSQTIRRANHGIKELAGHRVLEQPRAVLGKDRRIEAGLHQAHIQKPPIEQVEVELLTEGPLTADRVNMEGMPRRTFATVAWTRRGFSSVEVCLMSPAKHQRTRYVGLDVHSTSITAAVAEGDEPPTSFGSIANEPAAVRKLITRLGGPDIQLRVAYEAGPTGYALHRQLSAMGIECVVIAPSLIPVQPGVKVKTDRRDALKLARLLRSGDLTPIWVPDEAHEALRNLVRARADAKADSLRAKHRLSKFLLRQGRHAPVGRRAWSQTYFQWLRGLQFEQLADRVVFADYLAVVTSADERLKRLEAALRQCSAVASQAALIDALQGLRGIGFLSAVTIVAESGDLRRFATAPQFMAYAGVVPSESSSGNRQHRGRITKTGNALLRHVLGEAAHHARHAPHVSGSLKQRQAQLPQPIVDLSWRAQLRLHHRYRQLGARIGPYRTVTSIARELAGFVWAVGQLQQATPPAA